MGREIDSGRIDDLHSLAIKYPQAPGSVLNFDRPIWSMGVEPLAIEMGQYTLMKASAAQPMGPWMAAQRGHEIGFGMDIWRPTTDRLERRSIGDEMGVMVM